MSNNSYPNSTLSKQGQVGSTSTKNSDESHNNSKYDSALADEKHPTDVFISISNKLSVYSVNSVVSLTARKLLNGL